MTIFVELFEKGNNVEIGAFGAKQNLLPQGVKEITMHMLFYTVFYSSV